MKIKVRSIILAMVISVVFVGMGNEESRIARAKERLSIITTNFPAYDFVRTLAQERADVRMLLPPGSESHTFEPTPQDLVSIQQSDLFLFVGGESEHWIEEMLATMGEDAPVTLSMMQCVEALPEEATASMTLEADLEDEHEHSHGTYAHEMDEHVWTSPKNVRLIVQKYSEILQQLDVLHQEDYRERAKAYDEQLSRLDQAFENVVAQGKHRKIIFGDRFPFRYFAADYGIDYDAAFPGCSEDSEPSAQTIASLIREIQTHGIPAVFYIEASNRKTADILAEETGAKPLLMHSCHTISQAELEQGVTYLSLMWGNVTHLKEALQ